jgi:hypothetical protein
VTDATARPPESGHDIRLGELAVVFRRLGTIAFAAAGLLALVFFRLNSAWLVPAGAVVGWWRG